MESRFIRYLAPVLISILVSASSLGAAPKVKVGLEVLRDIDFAPLKGKRVGLVTNPSGVDHNLKSTIEILFEAPEVNLVALYGPEHGVRGDVYAGGHVADYVDPVTGLTVHSLYGPTRKPTAKMLEGIDVMVYDIQDVGCRSFTYISTLGKLMEACAENDKELVVLDRPNPLGGEKMEGNVVEEGYFSFVSQFAVPYVYGLTPGELARLLNARSEQPCRLTVIPMEGWNRKMTWEETGLEWVVASPHVPQGKTARFYPVTGIFGMTLAGIVIKDAAERI